MFIKIVQGNHEALYECHNYLIEPEGTESIRELKGSPFTIHMEGGCNLSLKIDKNTSEAMVVYAMNGDGKTVDTIFYKTKTVSS